MPEPLRKDRCEICHWWVYEWEDNGMPKRKFGRCHRCAPKSGKSWPITDSNDFCGEFELDEGKKKKCEEERINALCVNIEGVNIEDFKNA